jgi:hypothetical protein
MALQVALPPPLPPAPMDAGSHQLPLPLDPPTPSSPPPASAAPDMVSPQQVWPRLVAPARAHLRQTFARVLQEVLHDDSGPQPRER